MAPARVTNRLRVLYLDAYDSFANNLIAQIEQSTGAEVVRCYIDSDPDAWLIPEEARAQVATPAAFTSYAKTFDAVVAGPGPGSAVCDEDVGWMRVLWRLKEEDLVPVFCVGLGFQSMCHAFGADIATLEEPRQVVEANILHNGTSAFGGVKQLQAMLYHSLQVMLGHQIQTEKTVRYPAQLWESTEMCPDLQPLAWDCENRQNGAVLMAARHKSKPFFGVQFHLGSVGTNEEGARIVTNWWSEVEAWNARRRCTTTSGEVGSAIRGPPAVKESSIEALTMRLVHGEGAHSTDSTTLDVQCATTGSGRLTVSDIVEIFDGPRGEAIVLESGLQLDLRPVRTGVGRHSIIGLVIPGETMRLHYYTSNHVMELRDGNNKVVQKWDTQDPWQWIKGVMARLKGMLGQKPKTPTWAPFWGGFMGYASYEAGLERINVTPKGDAQCPDICFAYITRSIVVDHQLKKIYVQSIRGTDDSMWLNDSVEEIYDAVGRKSLESSPNHTPMPRPNPFDQQDSTLSTLLASCMKSVADRDAYYSSVLSCKKHIADGQSTSFSMTTANQIHGRRPRICRLSKAEDNELSWKLYKRIVACNHAPFGAYMRLHNVHILSASPERLLSWDRRQVAQCRSVNGTVVKGIKTEIDDINDNLGSQKVRAENLLHVDLVRHQLHGVYGASNVTVPQLVQLESTDFAFQIVSVIEGIPPSLSARQAGDSSHECADVDDAPPSFELPHNDRESTFGITALTHCLPAALTGAAQHRAASLAQDIAPSRRGIHTGVIGYLDVGGAGDFSVAVRTAVKVDASTPAAATEDVWSITPNTLVTSMSVPEETYGDMLVEFQRVARAFEMREVQVEEVEMEKVDAGLRGVWSRLMEVEEAEGAGEEGEDRGGRAALGMLRGFREGLLAGRGA